jgi:hypothetical protein
MNMGFKLLSACGNLTFVSGCRGAIAFSGTLALSSYGTGEFGPTEGRGVSLTADNGVPLPANN